MMNQKVSLQQMIPVLFVLLLIGAFGVLFVLNVNPPAFPRFSALADNPAGAVEADVFDYAQAAEVSALRWQAMARFYEQQGRLTRDNFDYEQAADNLAYRWQAMADWYENAGLLNKGMDPGDVMAYRWLAMARAYEQWGMLNDN